MQRRLGQARALARNVDGLAGGVLAMDALDELERARHREQLLDVLFLQQQGHGGRMAKTAIL
jgi:hypothetical protein